MATVTRRFWINLNNMRVTDALDSRSPIQELRFKARDSARLGFQFHRDGTPELLPSGTTIAAGCKSLNDFAGDFLFSQSSWTAATTTNASAQVDTDFYYATVSLNTTEVTTALGDNDPTLAAMFELELDISGAGERISTDTITTTVYNDVVRGGEGTATSGNPPWPSDVSELIRYKKGVTSLTGGLSADLDAIATTSIDVPYSVAIYNADAGDELEFWTLKSGTDAEDTGNGIVRPDDYATTTNEKVWYRATVFPAVNDEDVAAAASATNYTPAASTVEGHLSGIDTALGTIGDVSSDSTPQLSGDLDTNGNNVGFDDGTGITDDSGNELVTFSKTASAVNEVTIANAATTTGPTISATGGDTNIDLNLAAKGSGSVKIGGSAVAVASDLTGFAPAARFRTVQMPLNDFVATAGSPVLQSVTFGASTQAYVWSFDDSATETIRGQWLIPNDIDATAAIKARLYWSRDHSGTGVVDWTVSSGDGRANGESVIGASTKTTGSGLDDTANGDDVLSVTPAATWFSGSDYAAGDMVFFSVTRSGLAGNDTMTGDAHLMAVVFEYSVSDDETGW